MESKKGRQKMVMLFVLSCLLLSGCACGRADEVSYSEASCQILMRSPDPAGCDMEEFGNAGEQ